jgi:HK97 family phage major capsid protein
MTVRLYKIKTAFGGKAAGDVVELDERAFGTSGLVDSGHIEEAPGVEDALVAKAIETMSSSLGASIERATATALGNVNKAVGRGPRIDVGEQQADRTKSFGDWLQQVGLLGSLQTPIPHREAARERLEKAYGSSYAPWDQKAALAEGTGVTGGYAAPPEYSSELLRVAIEETVLAGRARIFPMNSAEIHIPALDQTTVPGSSGQTAYTGGMIAYWTAEAATRTETEPKFKQVTLRANELSGYTLASRNILADNVVALEALLGDLIRETVGWYLDFGCLQGTGTTQPLGVLNAPATVSVNRAGAGKFQLADAAKMMGALLPRSRRTAIWIMAADAFPQLVQLVDASNRVVFLPNMVTSPRPQGSAQVAPDDNMVLLGRPVFFTEKLPALGTKGDVMLVDPTYYLVGQRTQLEVAASEHYKFINNQMTWRFVARVDGQPWMDKPLTLQDTSRQLSPYVVLN